MLTPSHTCAHARVKLNATRFGASNHRIIQDIPSNGPSTGVIDKRCALRARAPALDSGGTHCARGHTKRQAVHRHNPIGQGLLAPLACDVSDWSLCASGWVAMPYCQIVATEQLDSGRAEATATDLVPGPRAPLHQPDSHLGVRRAASDHGRGRCARRPGTDDERIDDGARNSMLLIEGGPVIAPASTQAASARARRVRSQGAPGRGRRSMPNLGQPPCHPLRRDPLASPDVAVLRR